ncbi:DUF2147 domain-containing protein [Sphingomonas tabacisoli]|uniref:DUF2147 domain-containing protein n=1 Tax=Sphingomonas tabacisoli TaxID=2249466 RepID=A0ABW4I694_9SPHN
MKMLVSFALLAATPAIAAEPVTGSWLTDAKDGVVEIAPCGAKLCGRLVKTMRKDVTVDRNNPDPALRNRPLVGLQVLSGFVADNAVWRGTGYDPKVGKSYSTTLQRLGPNTLKLRGCLIAFLCRSAIWTRLP